MDGDKGPDQIQELLASNILRKSVHGEYRFPVISPTDIKEVITFAFLVGYLSVCMGWFLDKADFLGTKADDTFCSYFHGDLDY